MIEYALVHFDTDLYDIVKLKNKEVQYLSNHGKETPLEAFKEFTEEENVHIDEVPGDKKEFFKNPTIVVKSIELDTLLSDNAEVSYDIVRTI